jgi:lipopolysaccharide biosynthesis glycosyltransferase
VSEPSRAIFTIAIGHDPSYRYGLASIGAYATRVNAQLIVVDSPIIQDERLNDPRHIAWLQKLWVIQQLKTFDMVLYLDADILVNPKAPDLFSMMADQDVSLAAYDESHCDRVRYFSQAPIEECMSATQASWCYLNAGVLFFSASTPLVNHIDREVVVQWMCSGVPCPEQTYLSYLVNRHKLAWRQLPRTFNFMDERGDDCDHRLSHAFVHFAGYGFRKSKRQKRCHVMRADWLKLTIEGKFTRMMLSALYRVRDMFQGMRWSLSKKRLRSPGLRPWR